MIVSLQYELGRSVQGIGRDLTESNRNETKPFEGRIIANDSVLVMMQVEKRTGFYYVLSGTVIVADVTWFL